MFIGRSPSRHPNHGIPPHAPVRRRPPDGTGPPHRTRPSERIEPVVGIQDHARGNGVLVGVGNDGLYRATRPGEWARTHAFVGLTRELCFEVEFVGGRFVAVGTGAILTSVDGLAWTATPVPLP